MSQPAESRLLLLGAGASVDAGIPAALPMARALLDSCGAGRARDIAALLEYVYSALSHHLNRVETARHLRKTARDRFVGWGGRTQAQGVDIEMLLRSIDLLARRDELEITPFVAAWDQMVQLLDGPNNVVSVARTAVERILRVSGRSNDSMRSSDVNDAAAALTEAVHATTNSGDGESFRKARAELESKLAQCVWIREPERVNYLVPLLEAGPRVVASLNYDNCVELAASQLGLGYQYCLDSSNDDGETGAELHLLKLHGSANWRLINSHVGDVDAPVQQQVKVIPDESVGKGVGQLALIFGQENKLTAQRPYFDLFLQFRDRLNRATELTVVGYSWRDDHVNNVVANWLTKKSARLLIVDPGWSRCNAPFAITLKNLRGQRIELINCGLAEAVPELLSRWQGEMSE